MMLKWPLSAKFFDGLVQWDEQEVERVRRDGCPICGKRLDRADFPRKPRGVPAAWEEAFSRRMSLCCSQDGCRRRLTPRSVRFLGRRVYAAVVVLASSVVALLLRVPRRTVGRWRSWWRGGFVETDFFRLARARLMPPVDECALPGSLVERFGGASAEEALFATLAFVSPLSTRSSRSSFSRDGP